MRELSPVDYRFTLKVARALGICALKVQVLTLGQPLPADYGVCKYPQNSSPKAAILDNISYHLIDAAQAVGQ